MMYTTINSSIVKMNVFSFRRLHGQRIQSIRFILPNANYTTVPFDINDAADCNLISCSERNGIIQDRVNATPLVRKTEKSTASQHSK